MCHSELLDALDDATDRASLLDAMKRVAAAVDLPTFSYLGWTDPDTPLLIANYSPAWRARFIEKRYDKIDPIRATAQAERLPFHWRAADYVGRASRVQLQMFDEAAELCLTQGITIPIRHDRGRVTTMTMVADGATKSFSHNVEKNRHLIHLVALHFDANITGKLLPHAGGVAPKLSTREIKCLLLGRSWQVNLRDGHDSGNHAANGRISPGKRQAETGRYDDAPGHRRSAATGCPH